MELYAAWPYFAIIALLVVGAGAPQFRWLDPPPAREAARNAPLDGLRGFLALSVFACHGMIYHAWLTRHEWGVVPPFYAMLGGISVEVFFMITGFLFWRKLVAEGAGIDWTRLYVGRVFRIGPVYVVAVGIMLAVALRRADWTLVEPLSAFGRHAGAWLALGVFPAQPVNGDPRIWIVLAGVTWSLQYEWAFYASLPLLHVLARAGLWHVGASGLVLAAALAVVARGGLPGFVSDWNAAMIALFAIGALTASLHCVGVGVGLRSHGADWIGSAAVVALVVLVFGVWVEAVSIRALLALGGAFFLVASGTSLFGLLLHPGAQRLGHISFGIYLLQGLVLLAAFAPHPVRSFALGSPAGYWTVITLAAVLLVLAAATAHVLLERPGISLGRRVADAFARPVRGLRPG